MVNLCIEESLVRKRRQKQKDVLRKQYLERQGIDSMVKDQVKPLAEVNSIFSETIDLMPDFKELLEY